MTTDRLIAILGLLIGLPAFFALFFTSEHRIEGALVSVIVVLVLFFVWWYRRQENQPQFSSLELRKVYRILTDDGSVAEAQRFERLRSNFHGATEWWNRGIVQDGTMQNIRIDGVPPNLIEEKIGAVDVCKRFATPLERGEEFSVLLTYEMHDAFCSARESVVHYNSSNVSELTIVIELPRPFITAELRSTYGGDHGKRLQIPKFSNNHRMIEAKVKRPRMGASYHVDWTW